MQTQTRHSEPANRASRFLARLYFHRLSTKRPTKRGKEKSPSDRHCQCEKEMEDHLQQLLKQSHEVPCKGASIILKINDNNILFGSIVLYYCGHLTPTQPQQVVNT
jgi:hypothetical protein